MAFHRAASIGFAAAVFVGCGSDDSAPAAARGPLEAFASPPTPAAPAAPMNEPDEVQEPVAPAATPTSESGPNAMLPIAPAPTGNGSGNAPANEPTPAEPTPAEPMGNGTMMTPPAMPANPAQLPPLRVWIAG